MALMSRNGVPFTIETEDKLVQIHRHGVVTPEEKNKISPELASKTVCSGAPSLQSGAYRAVGMQSALPGCQTLDSHAIIR